MFMANKAEDQPDTCHLCCKSVIWRLLGAELVLPCFYWAAVIHHKLQATQTCWSAPSQFAW